MLPKEEFNRRNRLVMAVAIIAMGALDTSPALAAIPLGAPVPNPELAKLRGGFDIGGMKFNFAFVSATCVNGSCTTANFNSNDLPGRVSQLQQVIQVQQGTNGIQAQINGQMMNTNVPRQINPQQALVTNVIPNSVRQSMPALTTIVQNTANNAVIQHISSLTMAVENATAVHQMVATGQMLQQSAIRSLPIP